MKWSSAQLAMRVPTGSLYPHSLPTPIPCPHRAVPMSDSPYTPDEQDEIDEIARIIWIGWDDEWTDIVREIEMAAGRLYVMGYRKTEERIGISHPVGIPK